MMNKRLSWGRKYFIAAGLIVFSCSVFSGTFPVSSKTEFVALKNRLMAAHFLSLATFGPTSGDIQSLAARIEQIGRRRAFSEWIDLQFSKPVNFHEPLALQMIGDDGLQPLDEGINHTRYIHHAWWHRALAADDQLRQRIAWALSQIFVINDNNSDLRKQVLDGSGQPQYLGVANYYDMLVGNAFGNYRNLLEDVSLHPVMGLFLSHVRNARGNPSIQRFPDENYARELMQLFSIGVFEMSSDGRLIRDSRNRFVEAYDNNTVKNFARVFTGLNYAGNATFSTADRNFHEPMVMFEDQHDTEEKILLQGQVLPAGQSGIQDIQDTLDNVFNHPNVPPFMARLLIQRLVTSNPSRFYIRRVSRAFIDNGRGVRGDLKAVIKAILLDREAINTQHYVMSLDPLLLTTTQLKTEYTRLREPILRYTAFYRAFNAKSNYPTKRFMIPNLNSRIGQAAYSAQSVFGFYDPNFQPPGDIPSYEPSRLTPNGELFAPEFQIMTPLADFSLLGQISRYTQDEVARFTLFNNPALSTASSEVQFDFSDEMALAERPSDLLARLDLVLCHGGLSEGSKSVIAETISMDETIDVKLRAKMAIFSVMSSSDCAIE